MHLLELLGIRPKAGQKSKAQVSDSSESMIGGFGGLGGVQGFGRPPTGTYETFRDMRTDPTVSLALAIAQAPIRSATWNVKGTDGAPEGAVDFITESVNHIKDKFVGNALFALQYGWSPFESIWDRVDRKLTIIDFKPLMVDKTFIKVDNNTGNFAGLLADRSNGLFSQEQNSTWIPQEKAFIYTHDQQFGDYYGRSRMNNCIADWSANKELRQRQGQYTTKVAGASLLIRYPIGESHNRFGTKIPNYKIAEGLLQKWKDGEGIVVPNQVSQELMTDAAKQGLKLDDLNPWNFSFLEVSTAHGSDFVASRRYQDALIFRGLLVPESVGTEGRFSSHGDTAAQNDVALSVADATLRELIRAVNDQWINRILVINWGTDAADTVFVEGEPISSARRALMTRIIEFATAPQNLDIMSQMISYDKLFADAGLPTLSGDMRENMADMLNARESAMPENEHEGEVAEPRIND